MGFQLHLPMLTLPYMHTVSRGLVEGTGDERLQTATVDFQ